MALNQEQLQAYSTMLLHSDHSKELHKLIIDYTHLLNSYGIEDVEDLLAILQATFSSQIKESLHL
jgi:cystathionine beta-lyase/cystathionine gamma-synthase